MCNDKYIKTKISLYNINFYDNKMPKENELYTFLFVVLLDYILLIQIKNIIYKYF